MPELDGFPKRRGQIRRLEAGPRRVPIVAFDSSRYEGARTRNVLEREWTDYLNKPIDRTKTRGLFGAYLSEDGRHGKADPTSPSLMALALTVGAAR